MWLWLMLSTHQLTKIKKRKVINLIVSGQRGYSSESNYFTSGYFDITLIFIEFQHLPVSDKLQKNLQISC